MPFDLDPISESPADGYYAKRALILADAGQEQLDAEARLDPAAAIADEELIQDACDLADNMVDGFGYVVGLAAVSGTHVLLTTDEPAYTWASRYASRWARAEIAQRRGEPWGGEEIPADVLGQQPEAAQDPNGKFARKRGEAERKIKAMLQSWYNRRTLSAAGAGTGIGVGFSDTCGGAEGIDPIVVNGGGY